jgi:hypothetical protein
LDFTSTVFKRCSKIIIIYIDFFGQMSIDENFYEQLCEMDAQFCKYRKDEREEQMEFLKSFPMPTVPKCFLNFLKAIGNCECKNLIEKFQQFSDLDRKGLIKLIEIEAKRENDPDLLELLNKIKDMNLCNI